MQFTRIKIEDVIIIDPQVHGDNRGISFKDPKIGIHCKKEISALKLLEKGMSQPNQKDADLFIYGENLYA